MWIDRKSCYVNGVVPVESTLPDLKKWGNEPLSVNIQKRYQTNGICLKDKSWQFPQLVLRKKHAWHFTKAMRTERARGRAKEVVKDLTGWGMGRHRSWRALRDTKDFGFCSKWNGEVLEDFEEKYGLAHFLKLPLWLLVETRLYFYG